MISVIVSAYNAENTIGYAIESVLAQSVQNFQLIICDDASTDATPDVVCNFKDERIIFFRNSSNVGPGVSRDRAIFIATGDWITFLDADDAYAVDRLECMLRIANDYPTDIIADGIVDSHDTPAGLVPWRPVWNIRKFATLDFCDFLRMQRTPIKPLIARELCSAVGANHGSSRSGEDVAFLIPFFANGCVIRYIPKQLYFYRSTPNSLSTANPERHSEYRGVFESAIPWFKDNPRILNEIEKKIFRIRKLEKYQIFYNALRRGKLMIAIKMAIIHPYLCSELAFRIASRIPYHIDRMRHGGAVRRVE